VTRFARDLGVHSTAVYHWIRGATVSRPPLALQIAQIARRRRITLSVGPLVTSNVKGFAEMSRMRLAR